MNFIQSLMFWQRAQKLMASYLTSEIRVQYSLEEIHKAVKEYQMQMTGGKFLLRPEQ